MSKLLRVQPRTERTRIRSGKPPPLIVVESSSEDTVADLTIKYDISTDVLPEHTSGPFSPGTTSRILTAPWHEYSDDAIRAAASTFADGSHHEASSTEPYFAIMRVLSYAVHNLTRARRQLEESRRILLEKEAARKERVNQLLRELQPSEKEVANRVLQSLFPNDDEGTHQVHRIQKQQSSLVSTPPAESILLR